MSTLRLPALEDGMRWYALFAELVPVDEGALGEDVAGGFLTACLPARDEEEAKAFFVADANESGLDVIAIEDLRVIPSILGLPRGEDGQLEPAIAEAFADPDLGAAIVHGLLHVYPEDAT